ncbi:hypothetical protein BDW75DRAFT_235437 [Aspergillus navahoensis]
MVDIPSVGIWELLFHRPQRPFPDEHAYTYDNVRSRAAQFGSALQRSSWNWTKGDILMVMSPNSIEVPPVLWGCHYAGGVVAPVNPELSVAELGHQLTGSCAKGLVVHKQCLHTALDAICLANLPKDRVLVLEDNSHIVQTVSEFIAGIEVVSCSPVHPAQDLAYLVYSSGTTGRPKGVMISHRNVVAAVMLQSGVESAHSDWHSDRTLAVLPIYHIYGLICLVHLPLWLGITTIFMDKFDLNVFCRTVQKHKITHVYVAPPIALHLAKNQVVDQYHMKSLQLLTSGGAPLAAALISELGQKRRIAVHQAYGLSETTSVSHIQRRSHWQTAMGSNGPPLPGLEARFVRSDGSIATVREEGELWVRGPTVFLGYRDEPAMTAESLTEDGWFKTGDIGYEDSQRNIYITDRSKDMIKFKGYQVAPAELEDLLLKHPAVKDAASEVPLAYVTLNEGWIEDTKTAEELLDYVRKQVIHYKRLRGGIIWTPEIPRSPSGKILKRVLRDQAETVDKDRRIGTLVYAQYRSSKL